MRELASKAVALASALAMIVVPGRAASAAGPDSGFGVDGVVVFDSDTMGFTVWAATIDRAGDTWVGGSTYNESETISLPWLVQLGSDGTVITEVTDSRLSDAMVVVEAVVEDSRGRIVIGGSGPDFSAPPVLARLRPDGRLDETFGDGGFVTEFPFPELHGSPTIMFDGDTILVAANGTDSDNDGLAIVALDETGAVATDRFVDGVLTEVAPLPGLVFYAVAWWTLPDGSIRAIIAIEEGGERLAVVDITDDGMVERSAVPTPVADTIPTEPLPDADGSAVFGSIAYSSATVVTQLDLHRLDANGDVVAGFAASPQLPDSGRDVGYSVPLRSDGFALVSTFSTGSLFGLLEIVTFDRLGFGATLFVDPLEWDDLMVVDGVDSDPRSGALIVTGTETLGNGRVPDLPNAIVARFLTDDSGRFIDDDASVHETDIAQLAALGITSGCNPPESSLFCPDDVVTRAQMASFLVRTFDLPPSEDQPFTDTTGSVHTDDIAALAAANITTGCTPTLYCPDDPVTRAQMASFLVRTLALPPAEGSGFTDTAGSVHGDDIAALAAAGITTGCTPTLYCPDDPVTRAQMASFLVRAMARTP